MKLTIRCPHCGAQFAIAASRIGQSLPCMGTDCTATLSPADIPFGPRGRYLVRRWLDDGGMGTVFVAFDNHLRAEVALKVPAYHSGRDPDRAEERFRTEIRAVERLDHPNICPVRDSGRWGDDYYFTMPFLEGGTMTSRLMPGVGLDVHLAVDWAATVAEAMAYAHRMGVVHRDLKPSNLMFDGADVLRVTDFGLALLIDDPDADRLTRPGERLGSFPYASPEQVRGDPGRHGPACDVYSLGVVLYELLTGRRPFSGRGRALEDAILLGRYAPPSSLRPDLDRALERIIGRAMAHLIRDRYPSMGDLADELADCVGRPRVVSASLGLVALGPERPGIFRCGPLGLEMARIPEGSFAMARDGEPAGGVEVVLDVPFLIAVHPITQGQYQRVRGHLPLSGFAGVEGRPVDSVTWLEAVAFCNELSHRETLPLYYRFDRDRVLIEGGPGYRLPTEAQWEYACRAGGEGTFCFGDDASSLPEYAWFTENSAGAPHEVGLLTPNAFGLRDVHGNVWEWCWDWYASDVRRHLRDGQRDDGGPSRGTERVLKGGSWNCVARSLRCVSRSRWAPDQGLPYIGFRVARSLE